ncbi:MAG: type II toxin-antitoxin system HicB family antitoxin [Candidatus Latescibacterota bacterium]|jgi:predicted RNase H-like HicB family nuclease
METRRFVYWQDGEYWLGYLVDFPDYMSQGTTLDELMENLRELYRDMVSGEIPGIRRTAELVVP